MRHKLLLYAAIAFVLFFIATNPSGAAATARGIGAGLADLATGVGHFVTGLTAGGGR